MPFSTPHLEQLRERQRRVTKGTLWKFQPEDPIDARLTFSSAGILEYRPERNSRDGAKGMIG